MEGPGRQSAERLISLYTFWEIISRASVKNKYINPENPERKGFRHRLAGAQDQSPTNCSKFFVEKNAYPLFMNAHRQ